MTMNMNKGGAQTDDKRCAFGCTGPDEKEAQRKPRNPTAACDRHHDEKNVQDVAAGHQPHKSLSRVNTQQSCSRFSANPIRG